MKKLICGLLALCLLCGLLTTTVLAAEVDSTDLAEVLERADNLRWGYDNRICTNNGPAVTAGNTTSRSYATFIAAKEAAQEELSRLYDEDGNPTPYNDDAGEAAENVAAVVAALEAAIDDLDKMGDEYDIADALVGYATLKNLMTRAFNPAKMDASDYTSDSWAAFMEAYSDAQAYMETHTEPQEDIGYWEAKGWVEASYAFWKACYEGLTDRTEQITVTLSVNDNYGIWTDRDPIAYCGTYEVTLPVEDATVKSVLAQALGSNYSFRPGDLGISDSHFAVGLYINGIYVSGESYSFSQQMLISKSYDNVRVKDGDEITLAFMYAPVWTSMIGAQTTSPASEVVGDIQYYRTESSLVHAVAGEEISLQVRYNLAMLASYNGAILPKDGIRVFISDAFASEEEARKAAAIHEMGTTDRTGQITLKCFSAPGSTEGWYAVSFFGSGNRGGLGNGMNVLFHVTDPTDLSASKEFLTEKLHALYEKYAESFYTDEQLIQVQSAYQSGLEGIASASTTGDANQAYEVAVAIIEGIQTENEENLSQYLNTIQAILGYLPTEKDTDAGKLYESDKELLDLLFGENGIYNKLSAYQAEQLSYSQYSLLSKLLSAYQKSNGGADLPESPAVSVTIKAVDIDTGETIEGIVKKRANNAAYWSLSEFRPVTNDIAGRFIIYQQGEAVFLDEDSAEFFIPSGGYYEARLGNTILESDEYEFAGGLNYASRVIFNVDEHYYSTNGHSFYGLRENLIFTVYVQKKSANTIDHFAEQLTAKYEGYNKTNYTAENWKALVDAYNAGLAAIKAAATDGEKQERLSEALNAMNAVPQKDFATYGYGTVTVSLSNTTTPISNQTKQPYDSTLYNPDEPIFTCQIELTAEDTMMTVLLRALSSDEYNGITSYTWLGTGAGEPDGYDITYLSTVSNGLDSLAEFDGGNDSGWMGKLNDFFVSNGFPEYTVSNGSLSDGDVIEIVYTTNLGLDVGGIWGDPDTTLHGLRIEGGTLLPEFSVQTAEPGDTLEYAVVIDGNSALLTVLPDANNKNYLTKTFLNEKVTTNVEGNSYYKRTQPVPVTVGDTVYVGVGEKAWPSMNKQGAEASGYTGTWYVLHVIGEDGVAEHIDGLIRALPAVTYGNYEAVLEQIAIIDAVKDGVSGIDGDALEAARAQCRKYEDFDALRSDLSATAVSKTMDVNAARDLLARYDGLMEQDSALIYNMTKAEVNKIEQIRRIVYPYGDATGDGRVTSADATIAYAIANKKYGGSLSSDVLDALDVNNDGKITSVDATLIYAYANNRLSKFPADG